MDDFDRLDLSALTSIPPADTSSLLALTDALRRLTPEPATPGLSDASEHLDAIKLELELALTAREKREELAAYGTPTSLDAALDAAWAFLRDRVRSWAAFRHRGFDPIIAQDGPLADALAKLSARADEAAQLHELVFRDQGLSFTKARFAEQSEIMAAKLSVIADAELEGAVDQLGAPDLLFTLRELQRTYEQMVADRLTPKDLGKRIGDLRLRLHRALGDYAIQVAALLRRTKPETLELVARALSPVVALREQMLSRRSASAGAAEEGSEPEQAPEADASESESE